MNDLPKTLARLELAAESTRATQSGLQHRQDDMLHLERAIDRMVADRSDGRVLIDQAEDVRRAVRTHAELQMPGIDGALSLAKDSLSTAAGAGDLGPAFDRVAAHLVERTLEEVRQVLKDLDEVQVALSRTSQAIPGDYELFTVASVSVDVATARIETARRGVFLVAEALPIIARAIKDIALPDLRSPTAAG